MRPTYTMPARPPQGRYGELLDSIDDPDAVLAQRARDQLVGLTREHMVQTARRMLRSFRRVKRWCDTDDVVQEAAIRLRRALDAVSPNSSRALLGLAAVQVRRELLDLAKRHSRDTSLLNHLDSNVRRIEGREIERTASAETPEDDDMERWVAFHEVAASLPEEEREVFDMVWYLGASQDDVAKTLGCSSRTVRRRWDSAKALFAARLQAGGVQDHR